MTTRSPIAGRRRLKAALRRLRDDQRLTQQQVADAMEWSLSKLIRIESGAVGVSATDLRALLTYYEVTDPDAVNGLIELARAGRRRPWWNEFRDRQLDSPEFVTLIGLEADVACLQIFNTSNVPGLLQTERYARAALRSMIPSPTDEELDVRVKVRLRRQREVLNREDPPVVRAVLDEAALLRMPTDPMTARDQLRHLIGLAERDNITIEVVPFSVGVYHLASPFFILSFFDEDDPAVVYLESSLSEELIESPHKIGYYNHAFQVIHSMALGPDESKELIENFADRLR